MNKPQEKIISFVKDLQEIMDKIVFVGGATLLFYIDKDLKGNPDIRFTEDIDIAINIKTKSEFYKIQELLKSKGYKEAVDSNIISRFKNKDIIVDIIPIEERILGFTNRWYKRGFDKTMIIEIGDREKNKIKILSPPYFLASKLEAFFSRGIKDPYISQDLDDIVFILNVRKNIKKEILESNDIELQKFISTGMKNIFANQKVKDFIQSCFYNQPERANTIFNRIKTIIKISINENEEEYE